VVRPVLANRRQGVPLGIWIAGLALVLGIAVFGGYLLLRDVNRDVRMTEVRAQFIASVSHELKTPLTAIRMFAETLSLGRSRDERTRLHLAVQEDMPELQADPDAIQQAILNLLTNAMKYSGDPARSICALVSETPRATATR
jgi:signal transduction histidine kinase